MEEGLTHYKILGTLGSTGLGLVWGWLIGSLKGRTYRPYRTVPSIFLATLVISTQILWFVDWVTLLYFYGAALFAFFIHIEWRRKLIHIKNP